MSTPDDCYNRALPDEPKFTLLARDPHAPTLLNEWADHRAWEISRGYRPDSDKPQVEQARRLAVEMNFWRKANNGKWRTA